jgi:inhibitor of KinA
LKVLRGSVGIAGRQTGVYPLESPGGWQIIGRTPLELFNPRADPPTLLHSGDVVRFKAVSKSDFQTL